MALEPHTYYIALLQHVPASLHSSRAALQYMYRGLNLYFTGECDTASRYSGDDTQVHD